MEDRAGGPHDQWPRNVKGKRVSVAPSKEQGEWLREAIANWRCQATLREVQRVSCAELFATVPEQRGANASP